MKRIIAITIIVFFSAFAALTYRLLFVPKPLEPLKKHDYKILAPTSIHGALSVQGNRIVDQNSNIVSFAGVSLFWVNKGWKGDKFYNAQTIHYLRYKMGAPIVRLALGIEDNGGYLEDPDARLEKIFAAADAALNAGMYFIIDWHSHHAEDHTAEAIAFFEKIALRYGATPNLIYEIYNEPTKASNWRRDIKPYAETVISAIRKIDADNLIISPSPFWDQKVHVPALDPIKNQINIAYSVHFYAATHHILNRLRAQAAINLGLPIIASEWGVTDIYAETPINPSAVKFWLEFMRKNQLISCAWSFHDKPESTSILRPDTPSDG